MERLIRIQVSSAGSASSSRKASAANTASVRNIRLRYAEAPSWTAWAMFFMFSVPSPALSTSARKTNAIASATSAMTRTTTTRVVFPPVRSTVASALSAPEGTTDMRFLRFRASRPSD